MAGDDKPVVVVTTAAELRQLAAPADRASKAAGEQGADHGEGATPRREVVTNHEVRIAGQAVTYEATCGFLEAGLDDPDKPTERLFYTAYVRTGVEDRASRPITFCFNGGPGSSSAWLHMGALGPRRVRVDAGREPRPPARAEDHPGSVLDVTDLVFVDPVGTGFSKPAQGSGEDYLEVEADVQSVAEFVRRYVARHGRWASPKYVCGESYGTTRAAALAAHLQARHGLFLNGLILFSSALSFQTLLFDPANDLPYVLYLPSYAATAAYHGVVDVTDVEGFVAEAEAFAIHRYAPALLLGRRLVDEERRSVAAEVARFTGLSVDYVLASDLRVPLGRFQRELLRSSGKVVGRLDSRFVGIAEDGVGERASSDPSLSAIMGAFASAWQHDLRSRLEFEDDEVYELLSFRVNQAWKFDGSVNRYLDVTPKLRQALIDNPHLRVLVISGRYDLATPAATVDYSLSHLGIDPGRAVRHVVYPAGHMMYVHDPSMDGIRTDLLAFYQADSDLSGRE